MAEKKEVEDIGDLTVSPKVIKEICGIGDRMVRQYAEEGVFKKSAHGKYMLFQSVKNYITTLKVAKVGENIKNGLGEEVKDLKTEQAIHEHYKGLMAEIRLQLIQGKVHRSEDVERVITDMLSKFKSKMQAIPSKLAPKLGERKRVDIQAILDAEIAGALLELSDYSPADYYSDEHIEVGDDEDMLNMLAEGGEAGDGET